MASWGGLCALLTIPASVHGETSTQLWMSFVLGHPKSERFYREVELQPKIQISGGKRWRNLDATWLVEYYPNAWFDLTGELVTGYTDQTDGLSSFELTPRVGIRFHLAKQIVQEWNYYGKRLLARLPIKRFSLATWLRLEYRNFFYSDDMANSHEVRFRTRLEFKLAINKRSLSADKVFYLHTDGEVFVPLTDDVPERFVNKFRFRGGLGYRIAFGWSIELLYMHDLNRESTLEDFNADANMVDLRLTHLF